MIPPPSLKKVAYPDFRCRRGRAVIAHEYIERGVMERMVLRERLSRHSLLGVAVVAGLGIPSSRCLLLGGEQGCLSPRAFLRMKPRGYWSYCTALYCCTVLTVMIVSVFLLPGSSFSSPFNCKAGIPSSTEHCCLLFAFFDTLLWSNNFAVVFSRGAFA